VDTGFPKLGSEHFPDGLPTGVSELAYTLDLSGYSGTSFKNASSATEVLR
jgi:hypothetical protein